MPNSIRSEGLLALGEAIAKIRRSRGMSQRQFATSLGVRQTFISKIELGTRRLDIVELIVLARAMNVDPIELVRAVESATPNSQKIF